MEEKGIVILIERGLTPRCLFLRSTLDFDDFWALSGGFWVVWRLSWYDPLDSRLVSPGIFKWFLFLAWVSIIRPSTPERARFSWFLMVLRQPPEAINQQLSDVHRSLFCINVSTFPERFIEIYLVLRQGAANHLRVFYPPPRSLFQGNHAVCPWGPRPST